MRATFKDANVIINNDEHVVLWMKPFYDKLFPLLEKTPNRFRNIVNSKNLRKKYASTYMNRNSTAQELNHECL